MILVKENIEKVVDDPDQIKKLKSEGFEEVKEKKSSRSKKGAESVGQS